MHLYRFLCGKLWIPQMSLNEDYRVPPTVRIHYSDFKASGPIACSRALKALNSIQANVWGKDEVSADAWKGVVKLGFSWGGFDVRPFKGLKSLEKNVQQLFEQKDCENPTCLVQEFLPNVVCEHRVIVFHDMRNSKHIHEHVWSSFMTPPDMDVGEFRLASANFVHKTQAAQRFFKGDQNAVETTERESDKLVDKWLKWFKTESITPPQCTRIDFLVQFREGKVSLWTCEVGECGASLCTIEVDARNTAALNNAIRNDGAGRFPLPFPRISRNNGKKS